MRYEPIIFPTLQGRSWAKADLAALARAEFPDESAPNPLLDPVFCAAWERSVAARLGADFTWGGHFEDRKHLWRGYYEGAKAVTHLGVDYNVPAGTPVHAPASCMVAHSWLDANVENGWGGRLILWLDAPWRGADHLVLGHLAHEGLPRAGTRFAQGAFLARTGEPHVNGGWFPHLHVQCATGAYVDAHMDDLRLLDGYHLLPGDPGSIAPDPALLVGREIAD